MYNYIHAFNFTIMKTANKFNAKKVIIDGITFDSIKEGSHYNRFKLLKNASKDSERVVGIILQPRYDIVVNGIKICFYKADFKILYADNSTKIYDVKGLKKGCAYQYFKLKKKLVEAIYGIEIIEL